MAKLSQFKKDVNAAENGVWITGIMGDIDVKVASGTNRKFLEALEKAAKPYSRNGKFNGSNTLFREIYDKCVANHILLDWRNVQDDDGNEIPYSSQKAFEILQDPENEELRKNVLGVAEENEAYRKEAIQSVAGK